MDESPGAGSGTVTGPGELGTGYAEWRCTECGHGHPKNDPPCDRCGSMSLERVEVRAEEFDDELTGAGYAEILRENALLAAIAAVVVLVAAVGVLAGSGVFVVSDPFGLGYRYGAVDAVQPDGDGTLTAGEFRSELEDQGFDVAAMSWSGRRLDVRYETGAGSNAALRDELGAVAVAYADYVERGGDAARLRVTAVTRDGGARVTVERSLAERFNSGALSREEYVTRALGDGS